MRAWFLQISHLEICLIENGWMTQGWLSVKMIILITVKELVSLQIEYFVPQVLWNSKLLHRNKKKIAARFLGFSQVLDFLFCSLQIFDWNEASDVSEFFYISLTEIQSLRIRCF